AVGGTGGEYGGCAGGGPPETGVFKLGGDGKGLFLYGFLKKKIGGGGGFFFFRRFLFLVQKFL
ncbi:hypothetical protein, partial [Listeria monocytogenes]|uniref:hypothetical protein n=1 Tax=Listeria monocytogenes TaxID=1639 RepID=UPI0006A4EEDB